MTGHIDWSGIKRMRLPLCRRCGRPPMPGAVWCQRCVHDVCCDRYPKLVPAGWFVDGYGNRWPRFRWVTCVHESGRGYL